ncbi:MAG TPA: TadE/TadG family type IV pilus assembly protein [Bryobacteraceae bacterium]|nr:TadE/TadG family type IV pilus assembly protein [Bryobacteraceae bacterium]
MRQRARNVIPGLRSERGNIMLEFALSCLVLIPLFTGTFQFGYAFFRYNKLQSAVREGARYAALRTYDSSSATPSTAFSTAVANMVVYGSPAGGTTPVMRGLSTSDVHLTVDMGTGTPNTMTVWIGAIDVDVVFTTLHWSGKPSAAFRYMGRFAP